MNYEDEVTVKKQVVSRDEAEVFLKGKRTSAPRIANATFLCIISPVLLIILVTMAEDSVCGMTEKLAAIIGLVFLFGTIAIAVFMFITSGINEAVTEHIEKDNFELATGVADTVRKMRFEYHPVFAKGIGAGVVLCILAVVPLIIAGIMEAPDYVCGLLVGVLLLMVGTGVNIIIRVSIRNESYNALLQEGDYTKAEKNVKKKMDAFSGAYWCFVTAGYLAWSFISNQWELTWIVWPIAGVLYGALTCVMKIFIKLDD